MGKRFGARIIDALIVGIPVGILLLLVLDLDARGIVYSALAAVANLAYFVWLESSQGGTLGKRMLGMSVASEAGVNLTAEQSFKRNWWLLLGVIPVIGPLASLGVTIYIAVTISSDDRNQGFHDKMADALVLDR
ncbi:MAG: RDD family protein [Actinobacteria bacterium]|nr:RDD family protein [Actinomycetota bacterium]